MKVLITGGAGFIGTNYVYYHLAKRPEDQIVVLDALTYAAKRENLSAAEDKGVKFVCGDIRDRSLVRSLFEVENFDWVVHFAAESHVDRSIKDPGIFVSTNVMGTEVLLEAAKDFGIKRFHHVSTDEVYGDLGFDSTDKFTEDTVLKPSSPYSASKAGSDMICLAYHRTFGLPVTISRCSNNYGPYQDNEKLIPLFISRAVKGEKVPLYGSGKNVRDWLYVEDHCEAVLEILEKGSVGEIYNIGGSNEQKNIDITKTILKILEKDESLIEYVQDRKGHDERYAVDHSKITSRLGWKPKTSFEEGLRKTIQWYTLNSYERSHSSGRDGIKTVSPNQSHEQTPAAGL